MATTYVQKICMCYIYFPLQSGCYPVLLFHVIDQKRSERFMQILFINFSNKVIKSSVTLFSSGLAEDLKILMNPLFI